MIAKYLDRVSALDMLDLYTQDFTLNFGSLRDVVDETTLARRVQNYHGRTVLAWIIAGPALMLQSGQQLAFEASRDMSSDTHSQLSDFIEVMKTEFTVWSLCESRDLGFPF